MHDDVSTNGKEHTAQQKLSNLLICITVDTDEDSYDKNQFQDLGATWRGMDEGVPSLFDATAGMRDGMGREAVFTWFVRCDERIEAIAGSPRWVLDTYRSLWNERHGAGDELGWHAHLFEDVREILDDKGDVCEHVVEARLRRAFESLGDDAATMRASRIGHAFFSNQVAALLERFGMEIDSSAMPGRVRHDEHILLDWAPTPESPYRPSRADYRLPASPSLGLVEVPFSMVPTQAAYDTSPLARYVDLAFRPEVMAKGLRAAAREFHLLVAIVHPSELLASAAHPLVAFDPAAVQANLALVVEECERNDRGFEFVTISEAVERWDRDVG